MATITIDGKQVKSQEGQMLIDVADSAGVEIPRFCYHPKLSVAANCRMCLVEVKGSRKPVPACATLVTDGMIVQTRSVGAKNAQKSVMEFLLINHPLDCPICDQGGECELQDVSLEFGADISRYTANKRVIRDKNIGPLIHTDLTRCIHCTRCVRFGKEIAGIQELGMIGRGEFSEITTSLEKSVDSELSGNVIDLCPVGALTSKPFRYSARPWEITSKEGIAAHDSSGSNLSYHIKKDTLKRVVPRTNEAINEVWLSDRDRFSYEGVQTEKRYLSPKIKIDGEWQSTDWQTALDHAQKIISQASPHILSSESQTVEELYLLKRIAEKTEGAMDTRLRRSAKVKVPLQTTPELPVFESFDTVMLVGSELTHEHPMVAHRIRKSQAKVLCLDAKKHVFRMNQIDSQVLKPSQWIAFLASATKALLTAENNSAAIKTLGLTDLAISEAAQKWVEQLMASNNPAIILGNIAQQSDAFSELQQWAQLLAKHCQGSCIVLPIAANSVAADQLGCAPLKHSVHEMFSASAEHPLVVVGIEPEYDTLYGQALVQRMAQTKVVALSAYQCDSIEQHADVILPIATYAETSGSFVNMAGQRLSFAAIVAALGDSKPCWKVLRVLANLLDVENSEYDSSADVLNEAIQQLTAAIPTNEAMPEAYQPSSQQGLEGIVYWHAFAVDSVVRNAQALQDSKLAQQGRYCLLCASDFKQDEPVEFNVGDQTIAAQSQISDDVAQGVCWIPAIEVGASLTSVGAVSMGNKPITVEHRAGQG